MHLWSSLQTFASLMVKSCHRNWVTCSSGKRCCTKLDIKKCAFWKINELVWLASIEIWMGNVSWDEYDMDLLYILIKQTPHFLRSGYSTSKFRFPIIWIRHVLGRSILPPLFVFDDANKFCAYIPGIRASLLTNCLSLWRTNF